MHKKTLRASTLAEMLVVMILTGIVLLSLFEGLALFGRLARRIGGRIERAVERSESAERLEALFFHADSLRDGGGEFIIHRGGEETARLRVEDSLLIVERGAAGFSDTLLHRLAGVRAVENPRRPGRLDSLILLDDTTFYRIGVTPSPQFQAEEEVTEIERNDEN